jgi:NADH:ubiquinone oxidoreductase subunit 5 (subunit L)/multisubunit Na+/H+ antiporter MnhA subunit
VHYALLNMTALSFVLVYTADHALVFLLGWEIAALAAWLLVIWDYTNQKVRFAGFNYLVSTHIGLMFLVAAFMILYTHSASWELGSFGRWLQAQPGCGTQPGVPAAGDQLRPEVGLLPVPLLAAARACRGAGACLGPDVGRDPQGRAVRAGALRAADGHGPTNGWAGS